jgi:hypothetical protein
VRTTSSADPAKAAEQELFMAERHVVLREAY